MLTSVKADFEFELEARGDYLYYKKPSSTGALRASYPICGLCDVLRAARRSLILKEIRDAN